MRRVRLFLAMAMVWALGAQSAVSDENLLVRPDVQILADHSVGLDLNAVLRVLDGSVDTASEVTIDKDAPVEIMFGFSGVTVTPEALNVNASGLARDSVHIEILVSEVDATSGFLTLRDQPLRDTENWQRFRFEPAAAKWMLVKLSTFGDPVSFDLSELEVMGYEGPPTSIYAFDEAPADAFEVLRQLQSAELELSLNADEAAMFDDASDGAFDQVSFAEASLLSSGVYDADRRAELLAEIDTLESEAREVTSGATTPFDKGQALLEWLHDGAMNRGYVEAQTDMSAVLEEGVFNCVSSATLYNILARRLGLDARGIEVPDHAFSILYDGTEHVDVETTTPKGFNPARSRAALAAFSRTTGYTYINDSNRSKRREIDDAGLVALTYYNHGVNASNSGDYPLALANYFKALSLDPRNKSAVKNTLAVLNNWSLKALDGKDYETGIEVLDVGLRMAPKDHGLRHNMRFALQEAMLSADTADETLALVERSRELTDRTGDNTFARVYGNVFQQRAMMLVELGQFEDALAFTENAGPDPSERLLRDIQRLRSSIFLMWANKKLEAQEFEDAIDVLSRGLQEPKVDYRIKNNMAYTAQEWAGYISSTEGPEAAQSKLIEIAGRFPELRSLQQVAARNYSKDGIDAYNAGDYARAIEIFQTAQSLGIQANEMQRNEEAAWLKWSSDLLDQGEFSAALSVLEQSIAANPKNYRAKNNIAYIVQEWAKDAASDGDILAAEKIVATNRARFPTDSQLGNMQSSFVIRAVNAARTEEDFEALVDTLIEAEPLASYSARYGDVTVYFYAEWAKLSDEKFRGDEALSVLQAGVDRHPEARKLVRLFTQAVTYNGELAMADQKWAEALAIFKAAQRSLPNERSFQRNIEKCEAQL